MRNPVYDIENILVEQKNKILHLCNEGQYDTVVCLLAFVTPLWEKCEYGYKIQEIKERIKASIRRGIIEADHWKTREKWEIMYNNLPW